MKNNDLVYAVEIYILVLGGDTSAVIDTLYFKNKKDAKKVTNYQENMNIPHTYGIKEVEYGDIPRKYKIIESVSGKNKGEILYNLSSKFKEIVDDYYKRYPERAPRYLLEKALYEIFNEYDAFLANNKYGGDDNNTHKEQFNLLSQLKGDRVVNAIGWIKNCYDCYYKDEYKGEDTAFAYLKELISHE